ncbi:MAG: hypothetical protein ABWW70_03845 [Thermoproteota archaeon]
MGCSKVRVVGGVRKLRALLDEELRKIYSYNAQIRGTGFYLKPWHVVKKRTSRGERLYIYIGRYWWRLAYVGKRGRTSRIRWTYVGRSKPQELSGYPDPPPTALEGIRIAVEGDDIVMNREDYEKLSRVLGEAKAECVEG